MSEQDGTAQAAAHAVLVEQRKAESAKNTGAMIGVALAAVVFWALWQHGFGYASIAVAFVVGAILSAAIYAKLRP